MKIIVPSLGRANPPCPSAKWLVQTKRPVYFAVHEDEIAAYAKSYPWAQTILIEEQYRHHDGRLRKHLLDTNSEPYFCCDDDVRVALKGVTSIDGMFNVLEHHINCGITHAGIGQQLFSNAAKTQIINDDPFAVPNKFASLVYAINPEPYKDLDLPRLRIYGDVALSIWAILHGGGSLVSFMATHSNASPLNGGCNSWRDEEIIVSDLLEICKMFPEYCSIRETSATTHSKYIGLGLRVAWSKIKRLT